MRADETPRRLLTERHMNIPVAIAGRHAKPGTYRHDELVADGFVWLLEAYDRYDPSRGASLSTWLYGYVRLRVMSHHLFRLGSLRENVKRHERRWAMLSSLDGGEVGDTPVRNLEDRNAGADLSRLLARDEAEWILKGVKPVSREAVWLHVGLGLTYREIGARMGCCVEAVRQRIERALPKLKARAAAMGRRRGRGNLIACPPPRSESQREAAARFCAERGRASRMRGDIPTSRTWYLADDARRLVVGPSATLKVLLAWCGVGVPPGTPRRGLVARVAPGLAEKGWRAVRGPEAKRLVQEGRYGLTQDRFD